MPISEGVFFSTLAQSPEKTSCLRTRGPAVRELDFWRFGTLQNGQSFGVMRTVVAMDPGYYEYEAALVDGDGICRKSVLLGEHYGQQMPEVMVALPCQWHLMWLLGRSLYCWDTLDGRPAKKLNDRLPKGTAVEDAVLRENGILELSCSEGLRFGYVYEADALLEPLGEGWLAHAGEDCCTGWNAHLQDCMAEEPLVWGLDIDEGVEAVEWYSFSECGLRDLRLPQSMERIGPEAFSENPDLERVTIPQNVNMVEANAFRGCTGLKEVRIEGSPDRVRLWDETAFADCPFEKTFLELRERGMASRRQTNRER